MGTMTTNASPEQVSLKEAEATYRRVQADLRHLSSPQLGWVARRAISRAESGAVHDLVTVRAIKDEAARRGLELPG